ncbi:MAG: VPLPA-CTERM sorting domain-containing protein [Dinoroseobacter sp.]|nr:VPLPA-CTERM sorting domain-containing protein [Dinoroseobacter sp.]
MLSKTLRAAVVAIAGLLSAGAATAATMPIIGGLTTVDVTLDLGPIIATPAGVASASGSVFSFPITGGGVDMSNNASIEHDGSFVTLSFGADFVTVGNFVIDTASGGLNGVANGTGIQTGASQAQLFTFGSTTAAGTQLLISPTLNTALGATFGTAALEQVFGTDNVTGAEFGLANTAPQVVPLPAAGWLLLAGVGGLAALKRKRRPSAA